MLMPLGGFAQPDGRTADDVADFVSVGDILAWRTDETPCATDVLARALVAHADEISPSVDDIEAQSWVRRVFAMPDVLADVLKCPEVASMDDADTINFQPIVFKFPTAARTLTIRYATQAHVLRQRQLLAGKRSVPTGNPSPEIGAPGDATIWTNTDPAWYGIMVVQAGALNAFVGADKNNTISLQYIYDNVDNLYPRGFTCTSKSALANDNDAINRAATATVGLAAAGQDDSNDYYVAGDVDLRWISYAEMGMDVVLTVATVGGSQVILGATKAARASKTLKQLSTSLRELSRLDTVRDYIRMSARYATAAEELAKIDRAADAASYAAKAREVDSLRDAMRAMEAGDDVKKYRDAANAYSELNAYRHSLGGLRAIKAARRGNVLTRAWRAFRAAGSGEKMLNRGAKIARSSMKSGRIRDSLFHATMRNAGRLARVEAAGGILYGVLKFGLDMYDRTEVSTDKYTSGLDFKPLLLLSADDLDGMSNVVNYGMWLMWAGDSVSAADDDAAYLQAMDFAAKFHQDLLEVQNDGDSPCAVDIYVVRPIIRNPGDTDQALFYLIMNDVPWTTAK